MEEFCAYLVKSSGLIALFYLAYHFLLRKETFFTSNRWFLQLGLCTAIILPLLVFTKTVLVETSTETIDWSKIPATTSLQTQDFEINWYIVLGIVYGLGVLLFLAKFILDFYSLKSILKGKTIYAQADYKFIDTTENLAPFSYFQTIVYNSSLYSAEELSNILDHEKIHCDQNHTVDVLITRVFCVLFWFNPIIWLYKKAILQNLEFIADHHATWKLANKKSYQITLLKITTQDNCVAITNHFYQSLIKKRIVMLNKNQSKKSNSWKYTLVLPALVAFVSLFQIEVIAQEKESEFSINSGMTNVSLHVTAKSTEKELEAEKDFFKQNYGVNLTFSKIKVNSNNEITSIKVSMKNKAGVKKVYIVDDNAPIKPFDIFVEIDTENKLNFGFKATVKDNSHLKNHFDHIKRTQSQSDTLKPRHIVLSDIQPDNSWSLNSMSKDGKEYQIVLNGTKQVKGIPLRISFDEDFDTQNILEPEEAMLKYGEFGKDGVWEIVTKKIKNPKKVLQKKNSKKPLLILNGKQADNQTNIDEINSETIESVTVLKEKEAIAKYGKAAKNGAVEINEKENKGWGISFGISKSEDNIKRIQNDKNVDYKKAVIVINGKISDFETLDKLKPEDIATVGVQKPSNGSESTKQIALKKYGEKALNGVVEIETKEFHKK